MRCWRKLYDKVGTALFRFHQLKMHDSSPADFFFNLTGMVDALSVVALSLAFITFVQLNSERIRVIICTFVTNNGTEATAAH